MRRSLRPAFHRERRFKSSRSFKRSMLFFLLSKTLGVLLLPTNFLIAVGLLGLVLLATRFFSVGRKLLAASLVLLAICGFSPLGIWVLYPLEQRFPPWEAAQGAPDGIVILAGAIEAELSAERGTVVYDNFAGRLIAAAALARRYPKARIIYTGGSARLAAEGAASEAD